MSLKRKIALILLTLSLCLAFTAAARENTPLLPVAAQRNGECLYGLEQGGKSALPCRHEDIRRIGSVYALRLDGRWALFALDGSWRTEYLYEEALPCEGGVLCIESAEYTRAVMLSYAGETLLDTRKMPVFEGLAPYAVYCLAALSEGYAAVYTPDGVSAFINAAGDMLPMTFCYTEGFREGVACVLTEGRWGYLSPDGSWLLEPNYLQAQSFHGGCALVQDAFGQAVIDRSGNILWRPAGDYVWQFCYGEKSFFGVHADGKDLYFTPEGTLLEHGGVPLIPEEYFTAKLPGGIYALLPDGREISLPGALQLLWGGCETLFAVETAAGYAVMDENGAILLRTGEAVPTFLQDTITKKWFIFVHHGEYFSVYTAEGSPVADNAYLTEPVGGWFALSCGWRQISH